MVKLPLHIIMPIKDSIDMAERAILAIVNSGHTLCIYDDYSTEENTHRLNQIAEKYNIQLIHLSSLTTQPSPNYRTILQHARKTALQLHQHLVITESDVIVHQDTICRLYNEVQKGVGLVAAATTDENSIYNFPYQYLLKWRYQHLDKNTISTKKRLSFCCTLLTNELLQKTNFDLLDPKKNWFDVTISHWSLSLGLKNLLMLGNTVLHFPHSSRPWKSLKYTNPWLYYWRKIIQNRDRI